MKKEPKIPGTKWSRRAVVYHIYPLSFKDSNGDGKGDLQGIIENLDYLNDGTENSLGVGAIWLSPIYKSPMADFGYDVSDYYSIDPIFGDLDLFDTLIAEANRRGMKVIMDFVPNHTSIEHPWFREKRDWYIWRQGKNGSPPNNWLSRFGGPAWTLDAQTGEYYMHTFLPEQPDLNWRNPEVKEEMLKVLRYWLGRGVDGFRTDAVYHLIKDNQFRNDPPNPDYQPGKDDPYDQLLHKYSEGLAETLDTINSFCEILGSYQDKFLVSEAYLDIPEMMTLYKACIDKVHAPFNFNLISLPWDAATYKKFIDDFEAALEPDDWPNYVLGNHDRSRVATRLGRERARLAAMLTFTLRGMPFIYYGDELGMQDVSIPSDKLQDPLEKRVPGFGLGRDPERTPMQWTTGPNAGFSDAEPWLRVAEDYKAYNVETERANPRSTLSFYKRLIHFRKNSPAILEGTYESLDLGEKPVLGYKRVCEDEKLLLLLNFSEEEQEVKIPEHKTAKFICNSHLDKEEGEDCDLTNLKLRPYEGVILKI